ncbi:MAG: S41 family peptidase [Candidatus Saccharibacteria bacterium]|jgi:carboxyl-terminal processing protease|nr:S41 family peptidase [Candidatus Saccharibacteria bacterium]
MAKTTAKESNNPTRSIYNAPSKPEKKVNLTTTVIVAAVTMAIGVIVGINFDKISNNINTALGNRAATSISFDELNDVYGELSSSFDGSLDRKKVIEEAKRGLVNAAGDKYTYYMNAKEAEEFDKELEGDVGAGIGVEIGERDGLVKVLRTTPDNPARKAGVLAGDIIYKADDEDISGLGVEDVAKKLRGEAGTKVKLTVMRDNKEVSFDLVREIINNVSVYSDYKGDAAIITITRFDSDTGKLAREKAQEAIDKKVKKVIIDLRGNGGGYVTAAQEVASLWVESGKLIVEQKSQSGLYNEKVYAKGGSAILKNTKTIVLVNGSTASASEIVAGALQDYDLAKLIGEKTYGKGSVQALQKLTGGELLRVTVAKWYTPKGKNINGEGIVPDKEVERTFDQINKEEDPQLDAALKE